jgi:ABC-2 type transport system permease protein
MTIRRLLRAYATEAKYESLRMLRMPGFMGPFLGLPVGLYLLFAVMLYAAECAKDPATARFMFMGFSIFGVMGPGMFGFGATIALEREQGLVQLKRALPMPMGASFVAKALMAMLFVAIIMVTMAAAAPFGHMRLSAIQFLSLSLVAVAGALPFSAMGFLVGSLASGKAAPAFVNVLYLPMIYLSGILVPLPKSMHWIAVLSPAYHLDQFALSAIGAASQGTPAGHAFVLLAVTLVFSTFALRRMARVG